MVKPAADQVRGSTAAPSVFALLLRAIRTHVVREEASRAEYTRLADSGGDPLVRLLLGMVAEDEKQNHELLRRMAASMGDASVSGVASFPIAPGPAWRPGADELAAVEAQIREERACAHSAARLARQHVGVYSGLFSMLLDVMALDSQKHQRVLEFTLQRMKEQRKVSVVLVERDDRLREHLSALCAALAGEQTVAESVPAASAALNRHIYIEEELLLPQLEEGRFDDMVATVTREHREMVSLMRAVGRLPWGSGGIAHAHDQMSRLCAIFEKHSQTAEFVLYRAFDALPDRVARAQAVERLETGEPPTSSRK